MTTPPDLTRKVRQLDNDMQSVYEMLTRIEATQQRHGNRQDEVADRLDAVAGRVDGVAGRVDAVSTTQAEHGAVLAEHGVMLARIVALLEQRDMPGE